MEKLLKVGLILDSLQVPAWVYLMLEKIEQGEDARISLLILTGPGSTPTPKKKEPLIYQLYLKAESKLSKPVPDALGKRGVQSLTANLPILSWQPFQNEENIDFPPEIIAQIRSFDLDVLINLSSKQLRGDGIRTARFGVWYYAPGDPQRTRTRPPGFWEVFENQPVTRTALYQVVDEKSPGRILYQSFSATDPLSVRGNCNRFLWKSASFVPRKLREIRSSGLLRYFNRDEPENDGINPGLISLQPEREDLPSNILFSPLLVRYLFRYLNNRLTKLIFHTNGMSFTVFRKNQIPLSGFLPRIMNKIFISHDRSRS
jgi:hypothetical protein